MSTHLIELTVNDRVVTEPVDGRWSLADFLREKLHLTGTHLGCEQGVCGSCTVLLDDGRSVRSCLMLAVQADGRSVRTVEGLRGAGAERLRRCFSEEHALQCGFCTPGLLVTATELLEDSPQPNESEIRACVGGHVCRCTGYEGIVAAIDRAARAEDDHA